MMAKNVFSKISSIFKDVNVRECQKLFNTATESASCMDEFIKYMKKKKKKKITRNNSVNGKNEGKDRVVHCSWIVSIDYFAHNNKVVKVMT